MLVINLMKYLVNDKAYEPDQNYLHEDFEKVNVEVQSGSCYKVNAVMHNRVQCLHNVD